MNELIKTIMDESPSMRLMSMDIRWVDYQWDYEKGSFDKWRASEERAIREIAESILSDPGKRYFNLREMLKYYESIEAYELCQHVKDLIKIEERDIKLNELGI